MSSEAFAKFIAAHIGLLFSFGVMVLLLATSIAWRLLERHGEAWWRFVARCSRLIARLGIAFLPQRKRLSGWRTIRFIQRNYLSVHACAGFFAILLALVGFVEFADEIDEQETLSRFDAALAAALGETLQAQTYRFFAVVTHFADTATLTALGAVVAMLLLWRKQYLLLSAWLLALIGNSLLNHSLKAVFARTRPLYEHGFAVADGWSFPSGHSSGALVAYGMLAYFAIRHTGRVWHLPILLGAIAIIQLVGGSRIILQVHYFSDVVAGFCSGAAWLAICIAGTEIAQRHRRY